MSAYPIPPSIPSCTAHAYFSAAEFFRDSPWLNVPAHRKADILVEPLYPRLGLLGGTPESSGGKKVSKLAALAAARKKKEGDKATTATAAAPATTLPTKTDQAEVPSAERKGTTSLSLLERLSAPGKQKPFECANGLRALGKGTRLGTHAIRKEPSQEQAKPSKGPTELQLEEQVAKEAANQDTEKEQPKVNIRAEPSTFATIIVGEATRPTVTEPSHLHSHSVDLMQVYGQDLTEAFDFAGPSPDDVVLNAQSSAKGLAIRRKV